MHPAQLTYSHDPSLNPAAGSKLHAVALVHPNTKQERKSHDPSLLVAEGSKLHAAGFVHPGSAKTSWLGIHAKTETIRHARKRMLRREAFRRSVGREERESRRNEKSMGLCFVFELDKIRKKPFECYDKGNERDYAVDEPASG
jgi:hypothetical protein